MADERDHVRIIRTSDVIHHRSEASRSKDGDSVYHNKKKDTKGDSFHGYDGHRESKRKKGYEEYFSGKRKVIDRSSPDERPVRVRSHVEVVKKPEEEKPILITVRNDIKESGSRSDYKNYHLDGKDSNKRWRNTVGEANASERNIQQEQQISHDESSDVDSDYTIEMRSHQGSDDSRDSDGSDNDSVYSMEFKNIGGSDEEDNGDDRNDKHSERFTEGGVDEGVSEQHTLTKQDLKKVDVDNKEKNNADDNVTSSGYSESELEEAADQERTVTVRKSREYAVDVKEKTSEILEKDKGISRKSNVGMFPGVYKSKRDLDENKSFEVSEVEATNKVIAEKERNDDSTIDRKNNVEDKTERVEEQCKVSEVDAAIYKSESKGIHKEGAQMKNKAGKEKKLLEEIKILEEKLGKEQLKKTAGNEASVAHSDRKETQKSVSSKSERSKSEKGMDRVRASKSTGENVANSGKKIENRETGTSRNAKVEKLKEGLGDKKSIETTDRNLVNQLADGKSGSDKKTVSKAIKEQSRYNKDAASNLPKADKTSTQVIKDLSDKVTVDKKQARNYISDDKGKSKSNEVKTKTSRDTRKQDDFDKDRKLGKSKKSQKLDRRKRDGSSSESSDNEGSNTESSSSSSSSDQSASDSESDSDTESNESESNKSSNSESDLSSDSSQSSTSDTETSSSGEENFKRRRRRSPESKPVRNDIRQKRSSPHKEKEKVGYISPLRTRRSEWGTRRNVEKDRSRRTDEKDRKLPERRDNIRSNDGPHRYSKERPRKWTRSRSRDRNQGHSQRRSRDPSHVRGHRDSRDGRDSRNRKDPQDRRRESRYVDDFKRDSSRFRNEKGSHDRKETNWKRSDDRDRMTKSSRGAPREKLQDHADRHSEKHKLKRLDEADTQNTKSPQKKTSVTDPNRSKATFNREKSPSQRGVGLPDEETSGIPVEKPSDTPNNKTVTKNEGDKPISLMELDAKTEFPKTNVGKAAANSTSEPRPKVIMKDLMSINKNDLSKTEVENEPRPLMEITLSNVLPATAKAEKRRSRRVSVTGPPNSGTKKAIRKPRDYVERRRVLRVEQPDSTSMDAELTYEEQNEIKMETPKEESDERKTVFNRTYLKRLSSGKAVYFKDKKVEPLMKPIDFDINIIKKSRIVENISDESEEHRNIRRVIDSSSVIPQVQLTTASFQPTSKRKVFSRLGRNITKSKNISINLKATPLRDSNKDVPIVKTENEIELDEKIKSIREKNAEILRRQKEIEEDIKLNS